MKIKYLELGLYPNKLEEIRMIVVMHNFLLIQPMEMKSAIAYHRERGDDQRRKLPLFA